MLSGNLAKFQHSFGLSPSMNCEQSQNTVTVISFFLYSFGQCCCCFLLFYFVNSGIDQIGASINSINIDYTIFIAQHWFPYDHVCITAFELRRWQDMYIENCSVFCNRL